MKLDVPSLVVGLLGLDAAKKKAPPVPAAAVLCPDATYSVPSCCDTLFGSGDQICAARFLNIAKLDDYVARCARDQGTARCCVAGPDGINKCKDMM